MATRRHILATRGGPTSRMLGAAATGGRFHSS